MISMSMSWMSVITKHASNDIKSSQCAHWSTHQTPHLPHLKFKLDPLASPMESPLITSPSGWRLLHMWDSHHLGSLVSSYHTLFVSIESLMSWFSTEEYILEQMLTFCYRDTVFSIIDRLRTGHKLTEQ